MSEQLKVIGDQISAIRKQELRVLWVGRERGRGRYEGLKKNGAEMGFVRTAKVAELPAGTVREFHVEGKAIALANVGGSIYAINNTCLHRGGPLGQGVLDGKVLTCPWHGWQFDVTSGKAAQNPAIGVDCYRTEVRGEDIFVEV